jgi:hypothetical protein
MPLEKELNIAFLTYEQSKKVTLGQTTDFFYDESVYFRKKDEIKKRLEVKLTAGVCSNLLIEQLTRHLCNLGEKFNDHIEYYHAPTILDIVELVENNKLEGKKFKHPPLKGLMKIHHSPYGGLGSSIIKNAYNYWFESGKIRTDRLPLYKNIIEFHGEGNIKSIWQQMYSIAVAKKRENNSLSGEWLIYKEYKGINYYLCLAKHEEGDIDIYNNKIKLCFMDFKFI